MKKPFFLFAILIISVIVCSFYLLNKNNYGSVSSSRDIVLQFITYNGYGNNLYIDNILTGVQPNNDISVTSILNIPYDTIYSTKSTGTDTISPLVTVNNLGSNPVVDTTILIYLQIEPGGYLESKRINPLGVSQSTTVTFPVFTYSIGTGYYFKAYSSYSADTNRTNDTLFQYSISLAGYKRNVLFEEFTCNSSPSCANNNTFINEFVNQNIQSVTAIKYHLGYTNFIDSFYIENPEQSNVKRRYYYISSVPTTYADGRLPVSIPYGDSVNLYTPYFTSIAQGTPFSMSVNDEFIEGDSIKTTINVNIISSVQPGNYRLKINAVERYIHDTLQGTNGESKFFDVFRAFYPDSNGINIPTAKGSYQFQYTYYLKPDWNDSMMYTAAFIQNDNTKDIMNSGKGAHGYILIPDITYYINPLSSGKPDFLNVGYNFENHYKQNNFSDSIQTFLNIELFEAYFPPLGWEIFNLDGFITFRQFTGANGPTFGGTKSVIMNFYGYDIPGQRDSMYSKRYRDLLISDTLRFDYAYAQYNSINIDSLIVKISTDGGLTFPTEIFRKGGLQLATAPQTTSFFIPTNNTQWKSYKYSLNGIVSVENNNNIIPSKFSLNQNYPNPFNPKTVISYSLPVSDFVKLVVYDILGKEIKRLVNEKQNPGNYEVSFDAGNLSSGIYFYRLTTEGFTDTRRMVLVK